MAVNVRDSITAEIFDYQVLIDALKGLAYPRNRINDLLRQGIIIRIKKGLYVFGDKYRRQPYSKELLANLVYGPSYVSLDYALAYYGIIPEKVESLTSVTPNRPRRFNTPVGLFIYRRIPPRAYETGMVRVEGERGQAFLIASPEKALADKIVSVRGASIASIGEMGRFLSVPKTQVLKIKLEVDTDPPSGFTTETRFLLRPVPFAVRAFSLSDLFAGKMHAVLCRQWKSRVKGRDWYDLVWFAAYHPELRLAHLEQRMLQTGHWVEPALLTAGDLRDLIRRRIDSVDIDQIRREVEPFVKDPASLALWSKEFFLDVASRIKTV